MAMTASPADRIPAGRLVLVRHGETEWSKSGQHTGRTDLPLTEHGEELARAAGRVLAGHTFGLVLSSPLQRAARTAELADLPADLALQVHIVRGGLGDGARLHKVEEPAETVE